MRKLSVAKTAVADTVTYENRKGDTYYLSAVKTRKGKTRLVFSRQPKGESVPEVPQGHEIAESVHGQVSLRKIAPSAISDLEVREVQSVIREYQHIEDCRIEVKGKSIVVYEPNKPNLGPIHDLGFSLGPVQLKNLERHTRYKAVMRFNLVDADDRAFVTERMCYRGSMEGWLDLHDMGSIGKLARKYIKHIGKESFYELPWG